MPAEHILTPADRCPCGKPQEGSGYCSYECFSKHDLGAPIEPATASASMGGPPSEAEREYRERVEFMSRLGFGDDKTEPAARLADIVDHIEYAFSQSSDHIECPAWCELCGERLADKDCEPCNGSGCGPRTTEGAYDECEHCAGVGRIHAGCVGKTYAELAAENALLEGQLATAQEVHYPVNIFAESDEPPYMCGWRAVCNHSENAWPCDTAKALGLDGGGSDER